MPFMEMTHEIDPAKKILDAIGDLLLILDDQDFHTDDYTREAEELLNPLEECGIYCQYYGS